MSTIRFRNKNKINFNTSKRSRFPFLTDFVSIPPISPIFSNFINQTVQSHINIDPGRIQPGRFD